MLATPDAETERRVLEASIAPALARLAELKQEQAATSEDVRIARLHRIWAGRDAIQRDPLRRRIVYVGLIALLPAPFIVIIAVILRMAQMEMAVYLLPVAGAFALGGAVTAIVACTRTQCLLYEYDKTIASALHV